MLLKFAYQDFLDDRCFKNTTKTNIKNYQMLLGKFIDYCINIFLLDKFKFLLLDRKKGQHFYKSVEFADLFDENGQSLIHVKIGGTPDLRYCIQQSIHSAEIFEYTK